jgi:hypothetical protein
VRVVVVVTCQVTLWGGTCCSCMAGKPGYCCLFVCSACVLVRVHPQVELMQERVWCMFQQGKVVGLVRWAYSGIHGVCGHKMGDVGAWCMHPPECCRLVMRSTALHCMPLGGAPSAMHLMQHGDDCVRCKQHALGWVAASWSTKCTPVWDPCRVACMP